MNKRIWWTVTFSQCIIDSTRSTTAADEARLWPKGQNAITSILLEMPWWTTQHNSKTTWILGTWQNGLNS